MGNRIPTLQYVFFAEAFQKFAALARQYHFYEEEIARMETSVFEMSPYRRKDDVK
nr:hypothetical protein [Mitsuokella multacida]